MNTSTCGAAMHNQARKRTARRSVSIEGIAMVKLSVRTAGRQRFPAPPGPKRMTASHKRSAKIVCSCHRSSPS